MFGAGEDHSPAPVTFAEWEIQAKDAKTIQLMGEQPSLKEEADFR